MGIYFATDIDRINNEYMPRLNLEIGRYINYSKLESMLSTQTLFFCNASRFDDEYEGEIPLEFFDGWAQQSEENYRRLNGHRIKLVIQKCGTNMHQITESV